MSPNLHCGNNLVLGYEENIQTMLSSVQVYTRFISVTSSGFRALQLKCGVPMLHQLPFGCLGLFFPWSTKRMPGIVTSCPFEPL